MCAGTCVEGASGDEHPRRRRVTATAGGRLCGASTNRHTGSPSGAAAILLLALVASIPGLRSIPRLVPLQQVIRRRHHGEAEREA